MDNVTVTNSMPNLLNCRGNDFTVNGKCSECGGCCTDCICMSEKEITRIKEYIKNNDIKPCNHKPLFVRQEVSIDFLCPFLNTNKTKEKCMIYEVRPIICKSYLCSEESSPNCIRNVQKRLTTEEFADFRLSVLKGKDSFINLGQTFYPDLYVPRKGDFVVMNKMYMHFYMQNTNVLFEVETDPDKEGNVKIHPIDKSFKTKNYPAKGLTRLM